MYNQFLQKYAGYLRFHHPIKIEEIRAWATATGMTKMQAFRLYYRRCWQLMSDKERALFLAKAESTVA